MEKAKSRNHVFAQRACLRRRERTLLQQVRQKRLRPFVNSIHCTRSIRQRGAASTEASKQIRMMQKLRFAMPVVDRARLRIFGVEPDHHRRVNTITRQKSRKHWEGQGGMHPLKPQARIERMT